MKKIIGFVLLLLIPITSLGYEVNVHKEITKNAIASSSIEQYLLNNLNITLKKDKFASDIFRSETAEDWMKDGSDWEDSDATQSWLNHFYDPTTEQGLTGPGLNGSVTTWGQPSLVWGKDYVANLWNWHWARDAYYNALTNADAGLRDFYNAKFFRSLGQVMHLVQDLASPAHVRNDPHGAPGVHSDMYEIYTRDAVNNGKPLNYTGYPAVDLGTFNNFDSFWKNDGKGLAEFTNSNFLSRDTNFGTAGYSIYKAPSYIGEGIETETVKVLQWNGPDDYSPQLVDEQVNVRYFQGYAADNYRNNQSGPINHLTTLSYFDFEAQQYVGSRVFSLNDKVHDDYAQYLIPRAVGYSAGLLNYFFRGTLDVSWPETGVYSIADGSQTPYTDAHDNQHQQFTMIKASILNTTPNDTIGTGTLTAVARYKIIPNYAPDLSNYPPDPATMASVSYSYSVSNAKTLTSEETTAINTDYADITFDFTNSPIPAGITDLTLQVVFKGTIGNEADNAIAVGMKDIMEPTHLVFWNLSDMFSLQYPGSEYELYTFDTLKNLAQPGTSLLSRLDDTGDRSLDDELYLQPVPYTFNISFWNGQAMSPAVNVVIPPGRHIRMIVLTNQSTNNYYELKWTDPTRSGTVTSPFPGVVNQADQSGAYGTPTPVDTFRQGYGPDGQTLMPIIQHSYDGIVGCKPGNGTYCPYPDEEAEPASLTPIPFTSAFN